MTLRLKPEQIAQAAEIIRAGGLVAFPTETVYGLGANALDEAAVRRIFEAKKRPAWDPVIVHLARTAEFGRVAAEVPAAAARLAQFMPGPLTVLMRRNAQVPDAVTAGRDKVGVRVPDHPVARALIEAAGVPIAAPSANRFGRTSPTTADHVLADLDERIDAVLDGGPTRVGVESTVLDITVTPPLLLRPGGISREQLESVLGRVDVYVAPLVEEPPESLPSPGVGIRHYAPRARVVLVESATAEDLCAVIKEYAARGEHVGALAPEGWVPAHTPKFDWGAWGDWERLAQRLFAGLRTLDAQEATVIVAPLPPEEGLGRAIRDRLLKSAKS